MSGFSSNASGIVPTTGSGGAGGTGTITPSTVQGGALTGTYGRTSTISAPVLRESVSLNDAIWGAVGDGSHDDSTAANAAITQLVAKGGGTLILPPLNPAGTRATWTFQRVLIAGTSNVTVSAYGAQLQPTGASTGGSMFKGDGSSSSPGTYITSNFRLLGGTVLGAGGELVNQGVVTLDRSTDCVVRDMQVTNWGWTGGGQVIGIVNSQRWRILDNTCVNCVGGTNSQNVINIQPSSSFTGNSVVLDDGLVEGNIVQGTEFAAVAVGSGLTMASAQFLFSIIGNPASGTTQVQFTLPSGVTYTSATIGTNPLASDVQTAIQASTPSLPANCVTCYQGPTGGSAMPPGQIVVAFNSAAAGLITNPTTIDSWTGGTNPQANFSWPPLRIQICNNNLESIAFAAVDVEIGGTPHSVQPMWDIQINNNVCRYSGTVKPSGYGIHLVCDGSAPGNLDYQYLYRRIQICGNTVISNGTGIHASASDVSIEGNLITAVNTGISCDATNGSTATNPLQRVAIRGGVVVMLDSPYVTNGQGINLVGVTDATVDTNISWPNGGTVSSAEGITLTACSQIDVRCHIVNAPLRAIRVTGSSGGIWVSAGTRIVNPSSQTAMNTSAIRFDGTLTDNCFIEGSVVANDLRGGAAQMAYAVDTSAATLGSFGVYLQGSQRFIGWGTAVTHGTLASLGDNSVWDTTGVRFTQGKRVTYGTSAPGSGTWGQGDLCWNQTPTSASQAFWMCTTGGSPGTWTGMNFVSSGAVQTGLLRKSANYTMAASDLGVIATTAAITITLPTNLTAANAAQSYVVKNATSGSITVSTGSTGKIDLGTYTNAVNATSETISTGAQANVYVPDTNVGSANYDWIKS